MAQALLMNSHSIQWGPMHHSERQSTTRSKHLQAPSHLPLRHFHPVWPHGLIRPPHGHVELASVLPLSLTSPMDLPWLPTCDLSARPPRYEHRRIRMLHSGAHHNTSVFRRTTSDHRQPNEETDAIQTHNTVPKRKPMSNGFERTHKPGITIPKTRSPT